MNNVTRSYIVDTLLEAEGAELKSVTVINKPSESFSRRIRRISVHPEQYEKKHRGKKIVIILVAAALVLTACTAIKPIRTAIANFIITIFEKGSFVDKNTDINGNDSIAEFYSPRFIPDEYTFVGEEINKYNEELVVSRELKFIKGTKELYFTQLTSTATMTLDTENAEIKTCIVNGIECMSSKNANCYIIIWKQNGYRFRLTMSEDITEETAKKIIESVKRIEFTNN